MNCAKSVKMIVILGCIVVNLVGCGMNDTNSIINVHNSFVTGYIVKFMQF